MKELSIEEKAQRYDKAFERAKEWFNPEEPDSYTCIVESIFPELKENEDEKIRAAIIHFISHTPTVPKGVINKKTMIAWLEKQGEIDKESYEIAEKEKREFVDDGFIKCYADFQDFKEGKTYWLEYVGNDSYNVRSDNLLGKTYHITPCQLYTIFKKQTWLEKQDEQKLIDKIEPKFKVGDYIERKDGLGCHAKIIFVGGNVYGCEKLIYQEDESPFFEFMFKNQDEFQISSDFKQNPTDKAKPKFHEGEWITNGDYTWKIVEVKPLDYILQSQNGNIVDDTISYVDEQFHSFNIKDAKDGDVLCTYECCEPKIVFILKGTPKKHYALSYYCYYNIMYPHFEFDSKKGCLAPKDEDVKPATKEQRDLLFQKMKEAGYVWDAERKELKKIDTYCQDNCKGFQETGRCFCDGECKAKKEHIKQNLQDNSFRRMFEQNPAWNKEDDSNLNVVIAKVQSDINNGWIGRNRELLNWLKSLKDRVQPKQEWSEEDEKIYQSIMDDTVQENQLDGKQIDWLRNIKYRNFARPQKQWEPSDEQMNAFDAVLVYNPPCSNECRNHLITLYNDLKKLKE